MADSIDSARETLARWRRWATEIRTPAFLNAPEDIPIADRFAAASARAGLGSDGFAALVDAAADPAFWTAFDAEPVPSELAGKDSIYFVITTKCNNGAAYFAEDGSIAYKTCGHCLNGSGPNGVSMTAEEIERVAEHLPHPLRELEISGGEVLHPDVLPLTLHALRVCRERHGPRLLLSLQTSGDFLRSPRQTKELVAELRRAGLRRIVVASMDLYHGRGASEDERFEERKRHYERVAENLAREGLIAVGSEDYALLPDDPSAMTTHFFGADIQRRFKGFIVDDLVPNARAARMGLVSEEDRGVRYCARHAGGRGFLGSPTDDQAAVSGGAVYPCCWHTERPLGDARATSIPRLLLSYVADPLALAMHLGQPHRAWEIAALVSREWGRALRDDAEAQRGRNECLGCRNLTARYASALRAAGGAAGARLWREVPVLWDHRTDREANALFASWRTPVTDAPAKRFPNGR